MIITCEKCGTGYELEASAIGEKGRMVKCTSCYHVWRQFLPQEELAGHRINEKRAEEEETAFKKRIANNMPMATETPKVSVGSGLKISFFLLLFLNLIAAPFAFPGIFEQTAILSPITKKIDSYSSRGLEFQNLKWNKIVNEDKTSLLINGEIVNNTSEEKHVPLVIISFINNSGRKIMSHGYPIEKKIINPGERIPFEPKISDIPHERVNQIYVDLGNKIEVMTR